MSESEPVQVALRVVRELERLGVDYLIGGSVASMLHGEPRATLDVDIVTHITPQQARSLGEALREEFFVEPSWLEASAARMQMFNVIHRKLLLKADVYVRPRSGVHAEEIKRAKRVRIGQGVDTLARVATPEDTVLQKLRSYRQWRDVAGVLKQSGTVLDRAYMKRWASELGVSDLLDRAMRESNVT